MGNPVAINSVVDDPAARENPTRRKSRILSIYIVHIGMFIFSLGFSIVLTGVYPYMIQVCLDLGTSGVHKEGNSQKVTNTG